MNTITRRRFLVALLLAPWPRAAVASPQSKAQKAEAAYVAYVERELTQRTAFVSAQKNDAALWRQVCDVAAAFLMDEWRTGKLQGRKAAEAFYVRCDRQTMTQNDLDNGRCVVLVGVAVLRPAEFSVVRLKLQTATRPK